MSAYLHLRKWVDSLWSNPGSAKALMAPAAFLLLLGLLLKDLPFAIEMSVGAAVAWIAFTWWRGIRMAQAMAIKGDRSYDRSGKLSLVAEYHGTESATAARSRKGKKNG